MPVKTIFFLSACLVFLFSGPARAQGNLNLAPMAYTTPRINDGAPSEHDKVADKYHLKNRTLEGERPAVISYLGEVLPFIELHNPGITKKIEKILTTSFSNLKAGEDYDDVSGDRSLVIKLPKPVRTEEGGLLTAIKIKGVVFNAGDSSTKSYDDLAHARKVGQDIPASVTESVKMSVDNEGLFRQSPRKKIPQGGMLLTNARNEFEILFNAYKYGFNTSLPAGFALFREERSQEGLECGAVISALHDNEDTKAQDKLNKLMYNYQDILITPDPDPDRMAEFKMFFSTVAYNQGRMLREFNSHGFIHSNFHLGNFSVINNAIYFHDLESAKKREGMTEQQFFGYLVLELAHLIRSAARLSDNEACKIAGIDYLDIVLQGYFHDLKNEPVWALLKKIKPGILESLISRGLDEPVYLIDHPLVRLLRKANKGSISFRPGDPVTAKRIIEKPVNTHLRSKEGFTTLQYLRTLDTDPSFKDRPVNSDGHKIDTKTARSDLTALCGQGILKAKKMPNGFRYIYQGKIASSKQEPDTNSLNRKKMLAFLNRSDVNWDLEKFNEEAEKYVSNRKSSTAKKLMELGLVLEFEAKFVELQDKNFGNISQTARDLNIKDIQLKSNLEEMGIKIQKIDMLKITGKTTDELKKLLADQYQWNLTAFRASLGLKQRRGYDMIDLFSDLGLKKFLFKKIREIYVQKNGNMTALALFFGLTPRGFSLMLEKNPVAFPPLDIARSTGLSKKQLLKLLDDSRWNMKAVLDNFIKPKLSYGEIISGFGLEREFLQKFMAAYVNNGKSISKTARYFGLSSFVLQGILEYLEVDLTKIDARAGKSLKSEGWFLEKINWTPEDAFNFFQQGKWNLFKIKQDFSARFPDSLFTSYSEFMTAVGIRGAFIEELKKVYGSQSGLFKKIAARFHIDPLSFQSLLSGLNIDLDSFSLGEGYLLPSLNMTLSEAWKIFERMKFDVPAFRTYFIKKISVKNLGTDQLFIGLGINQRFINKAREILEKNNFEINKTTFYFNLSEGKDFVLLCEKLGFQIDKEEALKKLKQKKQQILAFLEKNNWNLYQCQTNFLGSWSIAYSEFIEKAGIVKEFKSRYSEIAVSSKFVHDKIALYFGISKQALGKIQAAFDLDTRLSVKENENKHFVELIRVGDIKRLVRDFGLDLMCQKMMALDLISEFEKQFDQLQFNNFGNLDKTAADMRITAVQLGNILKKTGIQIKKIDILKRSGKTKSQLKILLVDTCNWDLIKFKDRLSENIRLTNDYGFFDLFHDLGLEEFFVKKLKTVYVEQNGDLKALAVFFGLSNLALKRELARHPVEFSSLDITHATKLTKGQLLELLDKKKWNLSVVFTQTVFLKTAYSYGEIISGFKIQKEFIQKFTQIYLKSNKALNKTALYFGINSETLQNILTYLEFNVEQLNENSGNSETGDGWFLSRIGLTPEAALNFFQQRKWNLSKIRKDFSARFSIGQFSSFGELIIAMGVREAFIEEFRKRIFANSGNFYETAKNFNTKPEILKNILSALDFDPDTIELGEGHLLASLNMTPEKAWQILEKMQFDLPAFRAYFINKVLKNDISYYRLLTGLGLSQTFAAKVQDVLTGNRYNLNQTTLFFNFKHSSYFILLCKQLGFEIRKDEVFKTLKQERQKILDYLEQNNWDLEKCQKLFLGTWDISYSEFLRAAKIIDEFKAVYLKTALSSNFIYDKIALCFGISRISLRKLRSDLDLDSIDGIPESERNFFIELIRNGDIERLVQNFSFDGAYRILLKMHQFTPFSLKGLLSQYSKQQTRQESPGEAQDKPRNFSFVRMRKLELPEMPMKDREAILTNEIIQSVYQDIVQDHHFLQKLLIQSRDPSNAPVFQRAYKKAYDYYKDVEKFKISGINEKAISLKFYQRMGIKFLVDRKQAILTDEPGLGKTIQAIAAALNFNEGKGAKKILIICPKSAKETIWKKQIDELTLGQKAVVADGSKLGLKRHLQNLDESRFVIVNYEAIRGADNPLRKKLKQMGFDCVIADEAHRIRNESMQTEAVLSFNPEYKILVSGTPLVGKSLSKMFNLLHWVNPEVFSTRKEFQEKYRTLPSNIIRLNDELQKMLIRRVKQNVLELPPKTEIQVSVTLNPQQMKIYKKIEKDFTEWLKSHGSNPLKSLLLLSRFTRLKQAAIDPKLVESSITFQGGSEKITVPFFSPEVTLGNKKYYIKKDYAQEGVSYLKDESGKKFPIESNKGESVVNIGKTHYSINFEQSPIPSSKYEELDELVRKIMERGEKVVIFTQYRKVVTDLVKKYRSLGVNHIMGKMSADDIRREIDNFQTRDEQRIFIATIGTGGEAIDLTAANNVIFVDDPWTDQHKQQAIDRSYRMGQKKPVNVYTLIAKDTVDEHIRDLLSKGKLIFKLAFEEDPSVSNITDEMLECIMKKLKYPANVIEKLKFIRMSRGKNTEPGIKERKRTFDVSGQFYIDFKDRKIDAVLENKKGNKLKIGDFTSLLKNAGDLSALSQKLLKDFFNQNLMYEIQNKVPVKQTLLWALLSSLDPPLQELDYHGEIEPEVEIASLVIDLLMSNENLSFEDLEGMVGDTAYLKNAVYLLDKNNVFKILSLLGVFKKQFYYNGKLLAYDPPIKIIPYGTSVSYIDNEIVKQIAPDLYPGGRLSLFGLSFEAQSKQTRSLSREEEIRMSHEASKGNKAAEEALFMATRKMLAPLAKQMFGSIQAKVKTSLSHVDMSDLYTICDETLLKLIPSYLQKAESVSLSEFSLPMIRKTLSSEIYSLYRAGISERHESSFGKTEDPFSIFDSVAAEEFRHRGQKVDAVPAGMEDGLMAEAIEILKDNGFREQEADIFLDYVNLSSVLEIRKARQVSSSYIKDIVESAKRILSANKKFRGLYTVLSGEEDESRTLNLPSSKEIMLNLEKFQKSVFLLYSELLTCPPEKAYPAFVGRIEKLFDIHLTDLKITSVNNSGRMNPEEFIRFVIWSLEQVNIHLGFDRPENLSLWEQTVLEIKKAA